MKSGGLNVSGPGVRYLVLGIRFLLGGIFVWSGLAKIRQPYDFLSNVYDYELVGAKLGLLVAVVLPWLEVLVGAALLIGLFAGGGMLGAFFLCALFVGVQSSALARGLTIACGCFSATSAGLISYTTLIRTSLLLLASGAILGWHVYEGRRLRRHPDDAPITLSKPGDLSEAATNGT